MNQSRREDTGTCALGGELARKDTRKSVLKKRNLAAINVDALCQLCGSTACFSTWMQPSRGRRIELFDYKSRRQTAGQSSQ
jgi:hypothetical protein